MSTFIPACAEAPAGRLRFGSLLFGADPETRFCREKRGRLAAAKGLSVD